MKKFRTINDLGNIIRYFRKKRGMTQAQLAKECKLTQVFISKLENGGGSTLHTLFTVLSALKIELSLSEIQNLDTDNPLSLLE